MDTIKLLVMSGSSRSGSFNMKLATLAAGVAREAGAEVTQVDLRELGLPVYDADVEAAGLPVGAVELRRLFAVHDAVLIASPEYNGFPTPLLINSLDWASRVPAGDGQPSGMAAMNRKAAGLLSASPGALGGLRSLMFVRQVLQMNLNMLIVPEQFALGQAGKAFDAEGGLIDEKQRASVQRVVDALLSTARAAKSAHA